jgi:hypothetical protein
MTDETYEQRRAKRIQLAWKPLLTALDVDCPKCWASPGSMCGEWRANQYWSQEYVRDMPHTERLGAARVVALYLHDRGLKPIPMKSARAKA